MVKHYAKIFSNLVSDFKNALKNENRHSIFYTIYIIGNQ
jgi:hypothetical protein